MENHRRRLWINAAKIGGSAVALASLTGAAFAAWLDNGPQILMSMAASGMAWCF